MIEFHYELDFELDSEKNYTDWLLRIISAEGGDIVMLNYVFCKDEYLLSLNRKYLNHNTLTDILTFDYSEGGGLVADIYISIERIKENTRDLSVQFEEELRRVMCHGLLHILGYDDQTKEEKRIMRAKEDEKINMFHVEQ